MGYVLQCIMKTTIRHIFMRSIYNGNKALIDINEARVIKGSLPSRQLKLILAWCVIHQDELMQNWELSKDGLPLNRINPLV